MSMPSHFPVRAPVIALAVLVSAVALQAQGNGRDAELNATIGGTPIQGTGEPLSGGSSLVVELISPLGTLNGNSFLLAGELRTAASTGLPIALPGEPGVVALTTDVVPIAYSLPNGGLPFGLPPSGFQLTWSIPAGLPSGTLTMQAAVFDTTAPNGVAVTVPVGGQTGDLPILTELFPTSNALAQYGYSLHLHDVTGDGNPEIISGAREDMGAGGPDTGRVYVHGGMPPTPMFTLEDPSPEAFSHFGVSSDAGDLNGDGVQDIVVGARLEDRLSTIDSGQVVVFFGPDFQARLEIDPVFPEVSGRFGHRTACGDFDGDGFTDLAVCSSGATVAGVPRAGAIDIFYGPSLAFGVRVDNPVPGDTDRFGYRTCAEDLDGDGFADLVASAPYKELNPGAADRSGALYVLTGPSFALSTYFPNPYPSSQGLLGADVVCKDLDLDGDLDIIAGAELDDSGGVANQGSIWVLNGPDFQQTNQIFAPAPSIDAGFGAGVDVGDFDGDQIMDIMVGEFFWSGGVFRSGRCQVLLGPGFSNSLIIEEPVTGSNYQFGRRVRAADLDGDGDTEMVVGVPQSSASSTIRGGAVYIVDK